VKVVFLAAASSIHAVRWVNALACAGVRVVLVSQHDPLQELVEAATLRKLPYSGEAGYFRNVGKLSAILREEQPDLLSVHYASGYGTTARLSGFQPTLLSVWGSDVYDFPTRSTIHRWWLRGNLVAAIRVASTSHAMAEQVRLVAPSLEQIAITPFGVETERFTPCFREPASSDDPVVIGTVKGLKKIYGIDILLDSAAMLMERLRRNEPCLARRLRVKIVGDGPQKDELIAQAAELGIDDVVQFTDRVNHDSVPDVLHQLDAYVALSRSESFGVAVIEASACGLPVVVSEAGGLPEVVVDGQTGFVVPRENPEAAADALYKLVLDADLRRRMGEAGRQRVISLYEWKNNVRQMIDLYEDVIKTTGNARFL
tara:strand:- start:6227 stop:7339 length:1113 start_codon:yes stop_codon:yes gene_type:complete